MEGHKIKEKIEVSKFLEQIQGYKKEDIEATSHTFFHFNEKQRKIYNKNWIKEKLFNDIPFLTGIQNNGCWALFYKSEKETWRIIVDIDIQTNKIYIVTFYKINNEQIPNI